MRRLVTILILALVCGGFSASGQIVYESRSFAMGRGAEGSWLLRNGSICFGFEQYGQWQDVNGDNFVTFSDVIAAKSITPAHYTTVHCGWFSFDVRGPAWLTATLLALALLLLLGLGTVGWSRLQKRRRASS